MNRFWAIVIAGLTVVLGVSVSHLSTDAVAMGIGYLLGVLSCLPALILMSGRRKETPALPSVPMPLIMNFGERYQPPALYDNALSSPPPSPEVVKTEW